MCDLVSGLVRKLQGTEAKSQNQTSRKTTVLKVPQMASCPSDVNKKVILTMCFSCFSVPLLKKT
jgi:hypothetical protein